MLQSWNKFCFTRGYIEVAVVFPGPDENTQGYVSVVVTLLFFTCDSTIFVVARCLDDGKFG